MLDLDALNAFVVFAEKRNFTHAAELLHISQPSLHVKIRKLADNLGVALYQRVGKEIQITEHGEQVARFGREMLEATAQFTDTLQHGSSRQPLILAAGEGTYLYLLGDVIRQFTHGSYSPLRLLTCNSEQTLGAVRSGKAHFGVGAFDSYPEGLVVTKLMSTPQLLVMPKSHPLANKRVLKINDLANIDLIVPPENRPHRQLIAKMLQSANIPWKVGVEANGWELMLHFVKLGLGCAIVNGSVAIPKPLISKPLKELPSTQYLLVHHHNIGKSGDQKTLKDLIIDQLKK
ncbi:MAG: LysR family transcriptional regulator [Gammaproteobacteria bacterium]|jgi:DNA-binding transcriptional LysR family regulator